MGKGSADKYNVWQVYLFVKSQVRARFKERRRRRNRGEIRRARRRLSQQATKKTMKGQ